MPRRGCGGRGGAKFKSKAQAGFMFVHHPKIAKAMAKATKSIGKLKARIKRGPVPKRKRKR